MADRKANIRLDIKTDGFKRGMKDAEKAAADAGKKSGDAIGKGMNEGAKAGFQALKGMFGQVKSLIGTVGGLLGGIGFASLTQGAIDSQKAFKQMAFNINSAGGDLVKWRDLQKDVGRVALKTKVDVDKLGLGLKAAFQETGDIKFAQESLEAIASTSRDTGAELESVGKVAGVLQQKFGLTSSEIQGGLDQIVAGANQGGASFEDLSEDLGEIAAKAKTLGIQGPGALRKMVGFLNLAKKETGSFQQAMTALPMIFDQIFERTSGGLVKSGGKVPIEVAAVDSEGNPRDPFDIIQDIIAKTGGDAVKLGEFGFGGEGLQTLLALSKDFQGQLELSGGDIGQASDSFRKMLENNAGSLEDVERARKAGGGDSAAANLQTAINKLKIAFQQPQMIGAIEKLAAALPKLADGISSVLDFIMNNPMTSAGVLAGGTFVKAGLEATIGNAISQQMKQGGTAAGAEISSSITSGGSVFAANLKGTIAGLAIPAVAAAVEQAIKLVGDVKQLRKDQGDLETNLQGIAEKQGGTSAQFEEDMATRIFGEGRGTADDIFGTGKRRTHRNADGTVGSSRVTQGTLDQEAADPVSVAFKGIDVDVPDAPSAQQQSAEKKARLKKEASDRAARLATKNISGFDVAEEIEARLGRDLSGKETDVALDAAQASRDKGGTGEDAVVAAIKAIAKGNDKVAQAVKAQSGVEQPVRVVNANEIGGTKVAPEGPTPRPQ